MHTYKRIYIPIYIHTVYICISPSQCGPMPVDKRGRTPLFLLMEIDIHAYIYIHRCTHIYTHRIYIDPPPSLLSAGLCRLTSGAAPRSFYSWRCAPSLRGGRALRWSYIYIHTYIHIYAHYIDHPSPCQCGPMPMDKRGRTPLFRLMELRAQPGGRTIASLVMARMLLSASADARADAGYAEPRKGWSIVMTAAEFADVPMLEVRGYICIYLSACLSVSIYLSVYLSPSIYIYLRRCLRGAEEEMERRDDCG